MKVALGGTFDPIHDGHRALFDRAFDLGDVTVGLTSDELAPRTRREDRYVRPYAERRADLEAELDSFADEYDREFEVRKLSEPTGIATEPQFDVLVVSPETETGGKRINEIRRERGHEPLDIEVVDHVSAEDGEIISSTRIVAGEIDEHGNLTPDRDGRARESAEQQLPIGRLEPRRLEDGLPAALDGQSRHVGSLGHFALRALRSSDEGPDVEGGRHRGPLRALVLGQRREKGVGRPRACLGVESETVGRLVEFRQPRRVVHLVAGPVHGRASVLAGHKPWPRSGRETGVRRVVADGTRQLDGRSGGTTQVRAGSQARKRRSA
jgi:pantetheine-phosphate adenylyltransferase